MPSPARQRPRVDVPVMKRIAADLDARHKPRWMILYGEASLQFHAWPMFDHPPGWLSADDSATLQQRIRDYEQRYLPKPGSNGPS